MNTDRIARTLSTLRTPHETMARVPNTIRQSVAEVIDELVAEVRDLNADSDATYLERNRLVALLAAIYPSGIARTDIPGWEPEWHGCVYIDLPSGQASWHYHDSHAHLFAHLPPYSKPWDGHTTEEKYQRVADLAFSKITARRIAAEIKADPYA